MDDVVHDYLKCGDLKGGFARVRCTNPDCHNEYLLASKTWRELIKKVWEVDPLTCPQCGSDLPAIAISGEAGGDEIISLIQDPDVIRQTLKHLGLWEQDTGSRCKKPKPGYGSVVHEDFDDGWPGYEEPTITFH